jgi:hypothetical protein
VLKSKLAIEAFLNLMLFCVAFETGLLKSQYCLHFPKPTIVEVTPVTVPVRKLVRFNGAFKSKLAIDALKSNAV